MKNLCLLLITVLIISCNIKEEERLPFYSTIKEYNNNEYIRLDLLIEEHYNIVFLNTNELRLLRNEIFARKGYKFKSKDLNDYFTQFNWYNPKVSQIDSINKLLSEIDVRNIEFIKNIEKQLEMIDFSYANKESKKKRTSSTIDTFYYNNNLIQLKTISNIESYNFHPAEGSISKYCYFFYDYSKDTIKPIKVIQGVSLHFSGIELIQGDNLIYNKTNIECCGGYKYHSLYNFMTNELFIVAAEKENLIQVNKDEKPSLWLGVYQNNLFTEKFNNQIIGKGFNKFQNKRDKNLIHIYSIVLSDENKPLELLDLYLPFDIYTNRYSTIDSNQQYLNLSISEIDFDKNLNEYSFIISFVYLGETFLLKYKDERFTILNEDSPYIVINRKQNT